MSIFTATEVASYVYNKYRTSYSREISPIKLQKSLYFLFAYWGGYIRRAQMNSDFVEDDVSEFFEEELFDDEIQAWAYGPVIPNVYFNSDYKKEFYNRIEENEYIREFIDDILDEIFDISDFKLVDISHMDMAWRRNYNRNDEFHDNEIPKEEIIQEYATR